MSKLFNVKSKKGISLAYALIVCLFLFLITGGIATVALLQQNETGSDLNVRQAYISAKSGLDTMKDALKNNIITNANLPSGSDAKYYVMYTDDSGTLHCETFDADSEANAKERAKEIEASDDYTLIGGEGTYFKIASKAGGDTYSVTALNVTGKYNNNVSMNKGDLSFDAVIYKKYIYKLKPTDPPTYPPTGTTTLTTTPTTEPSTEITTGPPHISGYGGGTFLMVDQQAAINELRNSSGSSAQKMLNEMHIGNSGGSATASDGQLIYTLDTQANFKTSVSYTPLVYSQTLKVTTQNGKSQISAYNQGVYLRGTYAGSEVNQYAQVSGNPKDLGRVSYFSQNGDYEASINCTFLSIANNFVTIEKSPIISYLGSYGRNYVYIRLEKDITFHMCRDNDRSYDAGSSFTKSAGWYKFHTDKNKYLYDPRDYNSGGPWEKLSYTPSSAELGCVDVLSEILSYLEDGGQIHTGCNETKSVYGDDACIQILGDDGQYIGNSDGGYSHSDVDGYYAGYYQDRSKMNIFLAPCYGPDFSGYFHWFAGRSFNLYYYSKNDFTVQNGANIRMSSPTIVLTIGPQPVRSGDPNTAEQGVTISNTVRQGGDMASFKIYGAVAEDGKPGGIHYGMGSCSKLMVMCNFNVVYNGGSYTVSEGVYTNVPAGLELFSSEGYNYFTSTSPSPLPVSVAGSSLTFSSGSSVLPASVNIAGNTASGNVFANMFTRLFSNMFRIVPNATTTLLAPDGTTSVKTIGLTDVAGRSAIAFNKKVETIMYKNPDASGKYHTLSVGGSGLKIQRELSNGAVVDCIVFQEAGNYNIGINSGVTSEVSNGIELSGSALEVRAGLIGSNYELAGTPETHIAIPSERYY